MLSDREHLGYDETMVPDVEGHVVKIMVEGKEYDICDQLFKSQALRGCVTQCWQVQ